MINKKFIFKLFTLVLIIVLFTIPAISKELNINNMTRIIIDPVVNNSCTINLYFDNDFTGKAFMQKNEPGYYTVYLPDTTIEKKNIRINYRNSFDKKKIKLDIDKKPFVNKEKDSDYIRISVFMNADYSLNLLSKNINNENLNIFNDSTISIFSLILLGFIITVCMLAKQIIDILRQSKLNGSYTLFPKDFSMPKPEMAEKLNFKRNLDYKGIKDTINKEKSDIKQNIKAADTSSFGCFKLPLDKNDNVSKFEINKTLKATSKLFKTKLRISKLNQTNPLLKKTVSTDNNVKNENKKNEISVEDKNIISVLKLSGNKGFYISKKDDEFKLFGFINKTTFPLASFKDLPQLNLQARYYDKNGENDLYIVRLDSYKSMVEISNESMKELVVL